MKDLSHLAGLPLYLDGDGLIFGESLGEVNYTRRRLVNTLKDVWMDSSVSSEERLYTTYLDVYRPEDRRGFEQARLNHGYVVMPPGVYGAEYAKLYGHYHPPAPGTSLTYPEVHMVLHGTGHFLLQKAVPPFEEIQDVILVEARVGDMFLIPPHYGHLTINPADETLVFEGFFARGFKADYEPYRQRRGGAYYEVVGEDGAGSFVANKNYGGLPPLRRALASDVLTMETLRSGPCCYEIVVSHPEEFEFLTDPRKYREEWKF